MPSVIEKVSGANLWTGTLNKRSCNDPPVHGSSEVFNLSFHSCKKVGNNKVVCVYEDLFYVQSL